MAETRTIPIVFVAVTDPIAPGFVQSYARPGGNVTGFTNLEPSLGGKWLGLLKEVAPNVARVAVIFNPITFPAADSYLGPMAPVARLLGISLHAMRVENPAEIERALGTFALEPNGGLVNLPDTFLGAHRDTVLALTARYRLPAVHSSETYVKFGGLMTYGTDVLDPYRGVASYVDRILRGAQVSDLPVQAPTKFKLVFNLKTAKALGLTIPESFLLRADLVIE
jgi:putative ABC transport system substrate-binding protein